MSQWRGVMLPKWKALVHFIILRASAHAKKARIPKNENTIEVHDPKISTTVEITLYTMFSMYSQSNDTSEVCNGERLI